MIDFSQQSVLVQVLAFVSLFFCLASLVFALNTLWRAHKMLATFIRWCIASVCVFSIRKILATLGYTQAPSWILIGQFFDIFQSFFFMVAAIEFYRIVKRLDGETPRKK